MAAPPRAVFTTGASEIPTACALFEPSIIQPPAAGLFVDPGIYGPFEGGDSYGRCLNVNGLTACPTTTDIYDVLVLDVRVPGSDPVAVGIGLAGNGEIARTILYSMEKA
jgi:hypothetical protein